MSNAIPKKPSSLLFAIEDKQLSISRKGVCNYRIRVWLHPDAKARNGNYWERFYPEFRLIGYPLPKPSRLFPTGSATPSLESD